MSDPDAPDTPKWMVPINQLVAAMENRYSTTPATATECLEQLDDGLMALGMETNCIGLW
jgi:hypothetical protein